MKRYAFSLGLRDIRLKDEGYFDPLAHSYYIHRTKTGKVAKIRRVNYEAQRFFLFFTQLGLTPETFFLEFHLLQARKHTYNTKGLYIKNVLQSYHATPKGKKLNSIYELNVLRKIYSIINANANFR